MAIEFAYQVVKDLLVLTKMEEADPIDPGTMCVQELAAMGLADHGNGDAYSWIAPRMLFALTEAPNATHEIVWVTDKLRRTKRKVVRFTRSGAIDLTLVQKKAT
jgi:hypothetical protein